MTTLLLHRVVKVMLVIINSGQWDGLSQQTSSLILKMACTFSSLMEMRTGVVYNGVHL